MLANEGMAKNDSFCATTPSAMVFGKSDGDRFAVTRDLTLKPGYVLQFKVFTQQGSFQSRLKDAQVFDILLKKGHLNKGSTGLGWRSLSALLVRETVS